MPKSKQFDEEIALECAMQLFWYKGYEATSIHDLLAHMGLHVGSLYASFGGQCRLSDNSSRAC